MKKQVNNYFPYLCDREVKSIKQDISSGYRFIYDRNNKVAKLEDKYNLTHGNVIFRNGQLMIAVKNRLVSVFKYCKLGKLTDPILYNLLSKYKRNHENK